MNIAGELADSGSIKIWLHKAINTQKGATSGPFILNLEKKFNWENTSEASFDSQALKFMYLCVYLFICLLIMLHLNEREKKREVLFNR